MSNYKFSTISEVDVEEVIVQLQNLDEISYDKYIELKNQLEEVVYNPSASIICDCYNINKIYKKLSQYFIENEEAFKEISTYSENMIKELLNINNMYKKTYDTYKELYYDDSKDSVKCELKTEASEYINKCPNKFYLFDFYEDYIRDFNEDYKKIEESYKRVKDYAKEIKQYMINIENDTEKLYKAGHLYSALKLKAENKIIDKDSFIIKNKNWIKFLSKAISNGEKILEEIWKCNDRKDKAFNLHNKIKEDYNKSEEICIKLEDIKWQLVPEEKIGSYSKDYEKEYDRYYLDKIHGWDVVKIQLEKYE